ncbi:glycoside hydrolase family 3 C-terminal domain-containing protein [Cellulomonas marina]|uniref:Beta-glucosidase n=1 Tax=Cellulomonas marina TaxID=988821 RepID=A0A1I0Z9M1_9CELL|nr:glycoside hydrolase family 3 C-terminal domain-containing protein [Cellulomonas marina]GIG29005.1 sugar hydrolase [Cellulomonas marina]SFB22335.1 beta-glucosidase [Cellulomonas marina]
MTLAEKVTFLHQHAPAVPRLGLAAFRTGTEALHGVSWLGTATVFPQPVGLAATWDPDLLERVGAAVATEVRAKRAQDPTVSLNVWAPVVNTLRHPLWGRGEEGYSEDADLTAVLATGYCRGLRGTDPTVWATVPTLKHYLAYSNETDRAVTSSHLPPQALREHELPSFTGPLAAGVVGAVMPSYNLVNGRPNHVARELLDELRTWAPHEVAVVSDAQAPSNLVDGERYHDDHVTSHAAALRAGVDSFTDNSADSAPTVERITAALAAGLVTEADVDRAVLRVLLLRERTGELAGADPYGVGADAIDTPEHRVLAREAAGRGVVVLADDGGVLPLRAPAVVAVVGPFADHVVHDWYSGTPPYLSTVAGALAERYPDADVRIADGADRVALRSLVHDRYLALDPRDTALVASAVAPDEATWLDVTDWGDDVVTLRSAASGRLVSGASWTLRADADRVGGWVAQETFRVRTHDDGTVSLQHVGSGRWLRVQHGSGLLVAEASERTAERFARHVVRAGTAHVAEVCAGADVVVVAVGNDPHVAGRETEDRPGLELPPASRELWRTARAHARAAVLAVVSSYPYAVGDEAAAADAVVWTCHAGQELGHGLVDVLSGDREPTGRLAQTWWRRAEDAGDLLDHDVVGNGQTYRWGAAEPLYAFGHGLSYTRVEHVGLTLSAPTVEAPEPTTVHTPAARPETPRPEAAVVASVTLHNAGGRPVDELVAVHVQAPALPVPAPLRRLAAWTRVALAPGETRTVDLGVPLGTLAVWDVGATPAPGSPVVGTPGAFRVQPGTYRLTVGRSAHDDAANADLVVTGPPAPVRRPDVLEAHAFHAYAGAVTSDRSRAAGSCVEVLPSAHRGWVRHDRLDLAGARALRLEVAPRALPGWSAPTVALALRPTGTGAWRPLGPPVAVPEAGDGATPADRREAAYAWRWVEVPVPDEALPAGPVDLRLELVGAARVARVEVVR